MANKIVVPDGMLRAVRDAYSAAQSHNIEPILEAALRWQAEELGKSEGMSWMLNGTYQEGFVAAWKHITHMYDSHEPESSGENENG